MAVPTLFTPSSLMVDLTSIGTLFAFILVSGGVLLLPRIETATGRRFKLPYINGQYIVPIIFLAFFIASWGRIVDDFRNFGDDNLQEVLFMIFLIEGAVLSVLTYMKKFSLIPMLGVLFCSYLLLEIPAISWLWFLGWMAIGLLIYFLYGYKHSKLKVKS